MISDSESDLGGRGASIERGEIKITRTDDGWQTIAHGLLGLLVYGAFILICLGVIAVALGYLLG